MFSFIMKFLFIQFSHGRRRGIWLLLSEIFSLSLTLYIFWMTNKLVDKSLIEGESSSYFHFLLVGELALIMPVSLLEHTIRNFLEFHQSHFLATLEGNQISAFKLILMKSFAELTFPLLRVSFMLLLSVVVFHVQLTVRELLLFALVQILGVVSMAAMASLTTYTYLCYNRGLKLVYTLNSLLVVIGGAYFPVSLFPPVVREYIVWLFPQSIILQLSRMTFLPNSENYFVYAAYFGVYIVVAGVVIKKLTEMMETKRKRKILSYISFS